MNVDRILHDTESSATVPGVMYLRSEFDDVPDTTRRYPRTATGVEAAFPFDPLYAEAMHAGEDYEAIGLAEDGWPEPWWARLLTWLGERNAAQWVVFGSVVLSLGALMYARTAP